MARLSGPQLTLVAVLFCVGCASQQPPPNPASAAGAGGSQDDFLRSLDTQDNGALCVGCGVTPP
jgi:hypothetical protein